MKLVYPAFEIADKIEDFKIMLFQHDGFLVFFRPEKERWRTKIKEVIDSNAEKLGLRRSNGIKKSDRPNDDKNQIRYRLQNDRHIFAY
jgi:hypothetical protein